MREMNGGCAGCVGWLFFLVLFFVLLTSYCNGQQNLEERIKIDKASQTMVFVNSAATTVQKTADWAELDFLPNEILVLNYSGSPSGSSRAGRICDWLQLSLDKLERIIYRPICPDGVVVLWGKRAKDILIFREEE